MAQSQARNGGGSATEEMNPREMRVEGSPITISYQMSEQDDNRAAEDEAGHREKPEGATGDGDKKAVATNQQESHPLPLPLTRVGIEYKDKENKKYEDWSLRAIEPTSQSQSAGLFDITVALNGEITLLSPFLVTTFREVVKYFPGTLNRSATSIVIAKPYAALYHYWGDLRAAIEAQLGHADEAEDECMAEENKDGESAEKKQIRLQFERLSSIYEMLCAADHKAARELVRNGLITFDHLWALYKPGDLLLSKDQFGESALHSFTACALRSGINPKAAVTRSMLPEHSFGDDFQGNYGWWNIDGWCMHWDVLTRTFTRQLKTFAVDYFPGATTITSIKPSPFRFHTDLNDCEEFASKMKDRGEKWRKLIALPPICKMYQGPAFRINENNGEVAEDKRDRTNLHERVIVHHEGYNEFRHAYNGVRRSSLMRAETMWQPASKMPVFVSGYDDRFDRYDHHPLEKGFDDLQAMLSPSAIAVYSIRTRDWYQITVNLLQDVQWRTSALDDLVLDQGTKDTIHALVSQHKERRGHFPSDFIEGKGQGLVILLHGNPGVGKTLAAETVAEFTQKPLIALNIGEMSVEANIERQLKTVFRQGSVWDAVLLLDEADVVLEERSYEDMKRNAIVSVFLRMIEYYPGILFLTTNRIRTMDNAFQSRIHIAVKFEDLNKDARRQIWKNLMAKLPEGDCKELEPSIPSLAGWRLNGRQIRNVFLVAQSIALKENKPLAHRHLEQVIRQTLDFQNFFRDTHEAVRTNLGTNWRNPNDYRTSERILDRELDGRDRELAIRDRPRAHQNMRSRRNISHDRDDDSEEDSNYEHEQGRKKAIRSRR